MSQREARTLYVQSENLAIEELARQLEGIEGCSYSSLEKLCTAEDWPRQRREFWAKVQQKADAQASTQIAKKRAKGLEQLNDEAIKRTELLLKINEQRLNDGIQKQPDGTSKITLSPGDLGKITRTIMALQHELRLHHNFEPDKPIEGGVGGQGSGTINRLIDVIEGAP